MVDDLTSTPGVAALVAGAIALLALLLVLVLVRRLRRVEHAQRVVLGEHGTRDVVQHAQALQQNFDELWAAVNAQFDQVGQRLGFAEQRLSHAVSRSAVIRYDAYGELSGRQSSSIALLDEVGNGVVMSSILHRDQARLYVKGMRNFQPEFELSPEELEAIQQAQASAAVVAAPQEAQQTGPPGAQPGAQPPPPPGAQQPPQPGAQQPPQAAADRSPAGEASTSVAPPTDGA